MKCTNHLLVWVLFALLNVGYGLRANPIGDLIGAQSDPKNVLMVAVLILVTKGWESRNEDDKVKKLLKIYWRIPWTELNISGCHWMLHAFFFFLLNSCCM